MEKVRVTVGDKEEVRYNRKAAREKGQKSTERHEKATGTASSTVSYGHKNGRGSCGEDDQHAFPNYNAPPRVQHNPHCPAAAAPASAESQGQRPSAGERGSAQTSS